MFYLTSGSGSICGRVIGFYITRCPFFCFNERERRIYCVHWWPNTSVSMHFLSSITFFFFPPLNPKSTRNTTPFKPLEIPSLEVMHTSKLFILACWWWDLPCLRFFSQYISIEVGPVIFHIIYPFHHC